MAQVFGWEMPQNYLLRRRRLCSPVLLQGAAQCCRTRAWKWFRGPGVARLRTRPRVGKKVSLLPSIALFFSNFSPLAQMKASISSSNSPVLTTPFRYAFARYVARNGSQPQFACLMADPSRQGTLLLYSPLPPPKLIPQSHPYRQIIPHLRIIHPGFRNRD